GECVRSAQRNRERDPAVGQISEIAVQVLLVAKPEPQVAPRLGDGDARFRYLHLHVLPRFADILGMGERITVGEIVNGGNLLRHVVGDDGSRYPRSRIGRWYVEAVD